MKSNWRKGITFFLLITLFCALQLASCLASEGDGLLLNELCKPLYEGRGVGTEGNRLAAQLLAERLKTYALIPLEGYTDFLIPFEQGIAVIDETTLAVIMEDGTREELVFGKDYIITGTASTINGSFPVSLQAEKADPSAVLFIDPAAAKSMPPVDAFATMVFPVDTLPFGSLGVNGTGSRSDPAARLPRINMLRSVYSRICGAEALDIRYNFSKTMVSLSNVVGILPGKDRTRAVILSSHFDGAGDQAGNRLPCALDNASGVAVVDLVLGKLAGTVPPCDVIFAFTNAEESGLTGAYDLSGKLDAQYDALYNINVDCVGNAGQPFPMQSPDERSTVLCAKMEEYLSRHGFSSVLEGYGRSDHVAFEEAGIPSVVLGTPTMGVIHTANDTLEHIDLSVICGLAEVIVDFIVESPDIHGELSDNHAAEAALTDAPSLAYNEAVLQGDTLYTGSWRWIAYADALRYHPSLPLPKVYKGCPIEACMVVLSTIDMPEIIPGQVITLPDRPQNIMQIRALYSDGANSYLFEFHSLSVKDIITKKLIGEEGYLLAMPESDGNVILGIGLQRGDMSLNLFDGDASDLLEIETGLLAHLYLYGTSKVTEENASAVLADSELSGIFEDIISFVEP